MGGINDLNYVFCLYLSILAVEMRKMIFFLGTLPIVENRQKLVNVLITSQFL